MSAPNQKYAAAQRRIAQLEALLTDTNSSLRQLLRERVAAVAKLRRQRPRAAK
jgi:hypothetical protein